MATSFPTYPATTFEQAVELAIFSSNQLHNVINSDALSVIEIEDGQIPSIRKALIDNLYFITPADEWSEGSSATVFNQLYTFTGTTTGTALWYAPTATTANPIPMGTSPEDDDNWRLYGWDTYSKSELNSTSGAGYIGTSSGETVQEVIDSLPNTSAIAAIAKDYGLTSNQIAILSTDSALTSSTLVYDKNSDKSFFTGNATGTPVSWTVSDGVLSLTTTTGSFTLYSPDKSYVGDYTTAEITLTGGSQYLTYLGVPYFLKDSTSSYTTTGTTSTSWETDHLHLASLQDLKGTLYSLQSGEFSVEYSKNLWDRLQSTGMFTYEEIPGEAKGVAGISFGGTSDTDNKAALIVDERGRIQSYATVGGKLTAQKVSMPFTMGTGYFNNQFEDRITHFPCAGQEDDDLSPGLLFTWDKTARKSRVAVVSPFTAGNTGYPSGSINSQVNLLSSYYDLGYGLNHSFDHFFTTDTASLQWGKVCTISSGTSGGSIKKFSAVVTAGSYVNYEQSTFLLEVNGQNLISTINSGNISRGNIEQWIKFTRISDSTNATPTMNNIPEVGVIVNTSTGNAEVWMKVPYYSPRVSITVLSISNPAYVTVDWSDWANNNLRTTEPSGITYTMTTYPINSQNYVKTNSGDVVYAPNKVIRVKDAMSSSSTYNRMAEFTEYGFLSYGTYFSMNRYAGSGVTVTKSSTGTYSVSGCTLSSSVWKVKPPVSWADGGLVGTISITSSSSGSFSFTLTNSSGTLIDIPDGTWVDFHVS